MSEPASPPGLFAERLEHLFQTHRPKHKKKWSNQDVADAINEAAGDRVISQGYIWQLRKGQKDNPTYKQITGFATFFGVLPQYFFEEPDVAAADSVRELAFKAGGLSEPTLTAIINMIDNARAMEGLPASPHDRI